jgi:putative tricarboxylic transport membrane protein
MPMVEDVLAGLSMVLAWDNLFWSFFGVSFGMLMGAIPGLTDNMAIVLLLPFTFYLNPIAGISMLMGLSKGETSGVQSLLFYLTFQEPLKRW